MAAIRQHLAIAITVGACAASLSVASKPAGAVDPRVEAACSSDYFAHCGEHDPDGQAVRRCMRVHGEKLAPACVDALVAAGEVSKEEVASRTGKSKR